MAVIKTKLTAYLGRALTLVQLSGLLEHCNSVHLRNPIMEMTKGGKIIPLLKSMTICSDSFSAEPPCLGLASGEELQDKDMSSKKGDYAGNQNDCTHFAT